MKHVLWFGLLCMGLCAHATSSSEALSALSKLQSTTLYSITLSIKPTDGLIYEGAQGLEVLQVLSDGVLAHNPNHIEAKIIYIVTSRRYADGDTVVAGLYQSSGTYSYLDQSGVKRTVYKFCELPPALYKEVLAIREDRNATAQALAQAEAQIKRQKQAEQDFQKSKARIAAEEAAAKAQIESKKAEQARQQELTRLELEKAERIAEAQQKAEQEELMKKPAIQKQRAEFARIKLSPFDFNVKHHYIIQKSIRKGTNTYTSDTIQGIEVIDQDWCKLAECHAKQDWLGMLSIIEDEDLDEYPSEQTITRLASELANRVFRVELKPNKPVWSLSVSCRTHQTEASGPQKQDVINKWNKSASGLVPRRDPSAPLKIGERPPEYLFWRIFHTKWYISSCGETIDMFAGKEQGKPYGVNNIDDATAERYEEWLRAN